MPLSRFSVLPEQRVINTYVSPDLRYLAAAGQARQQAYDEGAAFELQQQDAFSKFATRDVDVARKNQLVNGYTIQAQAVIDQYDGDVGAALPFLRKLASSTAADPFWQHATNALSRQKDYYEANKRISEKGGVALNFNDDAVRKAVYNEDGSYNTIDYDTQQQLDYTEPKQKLMADIAKDSRLTGIAPSQIAGLLQSGKLTGVTGQKVLAVARQNLLPYLGTDAGRQEVRVLKRQGYSDAQVEQHLLSSLAGIGAKQVGQEVDMDYRELPGYTFMLRQQTKAAEAAQALELSEGQTGATVNGQLPGKIELDKDGKAYIGGDNVGGGRVAAGTLAGVTVHEAGTPVYNYKAGADALAKVRANYKRLHPGESMPSDKELATLHNSAVENSGLTTLRTQEFTPKAANIASQTILGLGYKKGDISGLQGKQIMLLGTKGESASKLVTLPELEKLLGVDNSKEHKITSAQVTGRIKYNPAIPGAYKVNVTAGGKSYELAVSGPQQEQDWMAPIQGLVSTAYNGGTFSTDIGGLHVRAISAPRKDGKGFETQVRKYQIKDGKYVAIPETNADGSVKKDKNGKTIYAQSLDAFTDQYHQLFMRQNGDLFNVAGFTNKEAEDDPDTD